MLHDDCAQAERLVSGRLAWPDRAAEAALRRGQLASTARCFRADSIVTAVCGSYGKCCAVSVTSSRVSVRLCGPYIAHLLRNRASYT